MTRPVYSDPDFKRAATAEEIAQLAEESGCPPEPDPAHAGWDLSFGARLNYGRDIDGTLVVNLQLGPDYDGSGVVRRAVTPTQLVEHARHLLLVAADEVLAAHSCASVPIENVIDNAIAECRHAADILNDLYA